MDNIQGNTESTSHDDTNSSRQEALSALQCRDFASGRHLAKLFPAIKIDAVFKQQAQDFIVREELPDSVFGEGEHQLVLVEKVGQNTQYVARRLANFAGVREMDIGFCGLKDRQSVAQQWFSVYYGGRAPRDPEDFEIEGVTIKQVASAASKLRRGEHLCNHFTIRLREVVGQQEVIESRLDHLAKTLLPNYFGPQRFGIEGKNIATTESLFRGKKRLRVKQHGRYFSTARSLLFNELVSARLQYRLEQSLPLHCRLEQPSLELQENDVEMVSLFGERPREKEAHQQTLELGLSSDLEQQIARRFPLFQQGLIDHRIAHQSRQEFFSAANFSWQWQEIHKLNNDTITGVIELSFTLEPGCFATSVLRELLPVDALLTKMPEHGNQAENTD